MPLFLFLYIGNLSFHYIFFYSTPSIIIEYFFESLKFNCWELPIFLGFVLFCFNICYSACPFGKCCDVYITYPFFNSKVHVRLCLSFPFSNANSCHLRREGKCCFYAQQSVSSSFLVIVQNRSSPNCFLCFLKDVFIIKASQEITSLIALFFFCQENVPFPNVPWIAEYLHYLSLPLCQAVIPFSNFSATSPK